MAKTQGEIESAIQTAVYQNSSRAVTGAATQQVLVQMAQAFQQQGDSSANIPIDGSSADGVFINGSNTIIGTGTTFVSGILYVTFGEEWYLLNVSAVDQQTLTINSHFNLIADPFKLADLGENWIGPSITARLYVRANAIKNSPNVYVQGYGNIFINAGSSSV